MTIGIYGIFDLQDNCLYVGQSTNITSRWKRHISSLKSGRHKRKDFVTWFNEHEADPSALSFRILEECDEESDLNLREMYWFAELAPRFYGKQPSANEEWRHSEATKAKISASLLSTRYADHVYKKLTCVTCGKEWELREKNSKYCSSDCVPLPRRRGRPTSSGIERLNRPHELSEFNCLRCGATFSSPRARKFCSEECRRPQRLTEEDRGAILKLSKTLSTRQIAKMYDISHVSIYKVIKSQQR